MSDSKECIYREDALNIIANRSHQFSDLGDGHSSGLFECLRCEIETIPAAPVREVVTCGECIYKGKMTCPMCRISISACKKTYPGDAWFCASGKRADMRGEEGAE